MSKRDEQIARMKGLMTYSINQTSKPKPITECVEGADGKIYAIIREGAKYYIKTANKGDNLVTESFNYIGGFMNKKNNEFSSYNQASKHLELKMRSLNEAYGINKPVELLNPDKKESLVVEMTDTMKLSLARYRQIMNNAASIMNESTIISMNNTGNPEAPKTTTFNPNLGEPFTDKAEANLDKDLKATANDPEKEGEPFGDKEKTEEYKNAEYVPSNSVANQHPTGGKVVRVNESEFDDDMEIIDTEDDTDDIVGFASEDNGIEESEEEIDLDNIDAEEIPAEEESEEEIDLDNIDADLEDEEEIEGVEEIEEPVEEMDEIETLKSEIAELRQMIADLKGENEESIEDMKDVEDIEGVEDMEEPTEYELEMDSEEECEGDECDLEDEEFEEIENDNLEESCDKLNEYRISYSPINDIRNEYHPETRLLNYSKDIKSPYGIAKIMMDLYQKYEEYLTDDDLYWIEVSMDGLDELGKCYQYLKKHPQMFDKLKPHIKTSFIKATAFQKSDLPKLLKANNELDKYNLIYDKLESIEDTFENELGIDLTAVKLSEGVNLNSFGKHVGYRKKPMTLPKTENGKKEGYKDWNDESVNSEEPFGSKIGSSAPYDKIVEAVTKTVFENLKKKI